MPGGSSRVSVSRLLLATVAGLIAFSATKGGLFIMVPWAQGAAIAGITVGLIAARPSHAAMVGAIIGLLGSLLPPSQGYASLVTSLLSGPPLILAAVITCSAAAALAAFLTSRAPTTRSWLLALALLLIVGNMWFTTLTVNNIASTQIAGEHLPSFNTQLGGRISAAQKTQDAVLYFQVYEGMKHGTGFYPQYSKIHRATIGVPISIVNYREPTIFWLWTLSPRPTDIVIAFLTLATVAILSLIPLNLAFAKLPLVIPAACALAAYFLFFTISMSLFMPDAWAGAVALLALSALGVSCRSRRWKLWTIAAVVLAVLSVLVREITTFMLVAGLASSAVGDESQKRFRASAWAAGLVAFVVAYAIHFRAAQPFIVARKALPQAGRGSLAFMLDALHYATHFLGDHSWMPWVLAVLGLVGCFAVSDLRVRTFVLIATLAPLFSFLVLGNGAHWFEPRAGATLHYNYWGAAIEPLVFALVPIGLSVLGRSVTMITGQRRPALKASRGG